MPTYTLLGTPFSTFTRTIALGLRYKSIPFTQTACTPQSDQAKACHPFGYLPTLCIHAAAGTAANDGTGTGTSTSTGQTIHLCESQAIAHYIDRIAPLPSLHMDGGEALEMPEKMWEFVSLAASHGFPAVETGVVKPRVQALDTGTPSEPELQKQIAEGVVNLKYFLSVMEAHISPAGPFVCGVNVTWADLFLFPLLADLRAVPEGGLLSERMLRWMGRMDELQCVKDTTPGTLSVGARP